MSERLGMESGRAWVVLVKTQRRPEGGYFAGWGKDGRIVTVDNLGAATVWGEVDRGKAAELAELLQDVRRVAELVPVVVLGGRL